MHIPIARRRVMLAPGQAVPLRESAHRRSLARDARHTSNRQRHRPARSSHDGTRTYAQASSRIHFHPVATHVSHTAHGTRSEHDADASVARASESR
ncbi:hypothetical protein WS70_08365 [Burkholderia mayonis]|uniref:Uncharacterized protein n=1 Tax=Burkholderia mayonis TaxID=1385591 RepID=A0A1B4FDS0_9BURK|nr:hypothetical protein WS70_08365 [Burkholderia mayonis]KVE43124.1 hypothetical protein WS69_23950 [Burkholderia sp. BDU5]KVE47297.1 hypothetical protein WS70_26055 [Burkholderia mayonis]